MKPIQKVICGCAILGALCFVVSACIQPNRISIHAAIALSFMAASVVLAQMTIAAILDRR